MRCEEELCRAFDVARLRCLSALHARDGGIGTLGEKTLHRILKYTFEPDDTCHEVSVLGSVADIRNAEGIVEIQTRSFEHLVPKLEKFLPESRTTVVYPLPNEKILHTLDLTTGEVGKGRKSPKKCKVYDAFWEIYKIRRFLSHPNFRLVLLFLDVDEYRKKTSRRRHGSERVERIPKHLAGAFHLASPEDYGRVFLPATLPDSFTVQDYARATGVRTRYASLGVAILSSLGLLCRDGKAGRAYLYRRTSLPENRTHP